MRVVIIGNGISGITAARFIRKRSNYSIYVISAESDHFYSRTALMYIYMGHMTYEQTKPYADNFWKKNKIELIKATVNNIDTEKQEVRFEANRLPLEYDALILATGSVTNKFGWSGQDLDGVAGLYSLQDLEYMEKYSRNLNKAVIVGGGLIGVEMAEMLHTRKIPVTMLVREKAYWQNVLPLEEAEMVSMHLSEHGIDLQLETELDAIIGDDNNRVIAVSTSTGEQIDCGFVGLTTGVRPNIDWLKGQGIDTDRGILVDEYLQTNIPGIYAIGDCAQFRNPPKGRKPVEQVWYTGRIMGETVAATICGKSIPYQPGIWFNSAKFFDIEYQVYGEVPNEFNEETATVFWKHADGKKSIRVVYNAKSKAVTGFNLMGVRYRQEACENWIRTGTHVEKVLQNLPIANFDPEFAGSYEQNLLEVYNKQTGTNLSIKQKRGLPSFLRYIKTGING